MFKPVYKEKESTYKIIEHNTNCTNPPSPFTYSANTCCIDSTLKYYFNGADYEYYCCPIGTSLIKSNVSSDNKVTFRCG